MKAAAFEEKEYEAPLYNQLAAGTRHVWSPGQVFEHHIGFDYALFAEDGRVFRLHDLPILRGAVLSRYRWPAHWFRRNSSPTRLPNFLLNLFIQAKRPAWGSRPAKLKGQFPQPGVIWRFTTDGEQQESLELVAAKLKGRGLVAYAAPVFHSHSVLFAHTRRGTIVENSTFPSAAALATHGAWLYNAPGATGFANPDMTPVQEAGLEQRIAELVRSTDGNTVDDGQWRRNLKGLAASLREALGVEGLAEASRRAAFFELVRDAERATRDLDEAEAFTAYLTALAFCESHGVEWFTIA